MPPTPPSDPDATVVRPPRAAVDPDATVVRTPAAAAIDPEATIVRPPRATAIDHDATVIRVPAPPGAAEPTVRRGPEALPKRSPIALPPGFRLHEYRFERVLGQGGFGITYLAVDINLDAEVAIKEYLPEEIAFRAGDRSVSPNASRHRDRYRQGLDNFLAEARTLATFRHPNIVRVARFFEAHRTAYMVLEYERGQPLKTWWPAHAALGERGLVARLQPLLDGLATVHAAGYLHRDIKPENIQVRADDGRFVLLDFGSAGQTVALADGDAVVVTPGYAPIEQYGLGEQGPWTDVYALGATLYWAVTGTKPPDAEARAGGTPMRSAVDAGSGRFGSAFLQAIDSALEMDPKARPQSVEDWRARLFADHTLDLRDALRRSETRRPRVRERWRAVLGGVLAPRGWPLAVKLTVAALATTVLPMLATNLYNLDGAEDALRDSRLQTVELLARSAAGRIGQLLDDHERFARALALDAATARYLAGLAAADAGAAAIGDELRRRFAAVAAANPDVDHALLADAAGTVRVAGDAALVGRNLAAREDVRAALAGRPHTSGVVVAEDGSGGVFVSEPVRDAQGAVAGAVALRLHAKAVAAVLDEARHDAALVPFLVDGDGVVMHHPRAELRYRSLAALPPAAPARIEAAGRYGRERIEPLGESELAAAMVGASRPGRVAYRSRVSGVDEIAGYAPVPDHHWVVGVAEPRAVFEAPVDELERHFAASLVLAGLLFGGLALRFARGLVEPLRALARGADALKSGDFDAAHVDVRRRDELGRLARTFNVMVDVLRQRERDVAAARPRTA